jgi:hypothetical protein
MITATIPASSSNQTGEQNFSGTLSSVLGSTFTIAVTGAATVGFHLEVPHGGTITFEGSWDGLEWNTITMREMGTNGYVTTSAVEHEDYIGSCSSFIYIRFRTSVGGSTDGRVYGRFSRNVSTLEGIEHGNMPHKVGVDVKAQWFHYSSVATNGTVALPTVDHKKLVVSDLHFTISDASSIVVFSDGSMAQNNLIFRGNLKPTGGASIFVPISFSLPHVFSGTNRPLCFSQTGAATVDGVVHYYESE